MKTYDRIVSDGIQNAKHQYYFNTFVSHKNDIKKTWKTIDETLNRGNNKTNFPSEVIVDHKLISDHKEKADNFNVCFANIGAKLSARLIFVDMCGVEGKRRLCDLNVTSSSPALATRHIRCVLLVNSPIKLNLLSWLLIYLCNK